jgi:hypothetical protein
MEIESLSCTWIKMNKLVGNKLHNNYPAKKSIDSEDFRNRG